MRRGILQSALQPCSGPLAQRTRLVNVHHANQLLVAAGVAELLVALHHAEKVHIGLDQSVNLARHVLIYRAWEARRGLVGVKGWVFLLRAPGRRQR